MSSHFSHTIYVGNIPGDVCEQEIEDLFNMYGLIADIDFPSSSPGYCLIEFGDVQDAEVAVKELDGYNFHGADLEVELRHNAEGSSAFDDHYNGHDHIDESVREENGNGAIDGGYRISNTRTRISSTRTRTHYRNGSPSISISISVSLSISINIDPTYSSDCDSLALGYSPNCIHTNWRSRSESPPPVCSRSCGEGHRSRSAPCRGSHSRAIIKNHSPCHSPEDTFRSQSLYSSPHGIEPMEIEPSSPKYLMTT